MATSPNPGLPWKELNEYLPDMFESLCVFAETLIDDEQVVDAASGKDLVIQAYLGLLVSPPKNCPTNVEELLVFLPPYLRGVIKHRAIDHYRRDKRRMDCSDSVVGPSLSPSVFDRIQAMDLTKALARAIKFRKHTEERVRDVLQALLEAHTGQTNQEIAELLNLPIDDIRHIMKTIRKRVKQ